MTFADIIKGLIEIAFIGFFLSRLLLLFRETRALRLLRGLGVILVVVLVVHLLDLPTLRAIFTQENMVGVVVITMVILFTPEFKEALARLGGRAQFGVDEEQRIAHRLREICTACERLAESSREDRIGALIVLQRRDGLQDRIKTGIPLNAALSSELLIGIFQKRSPLHDGAVVIRDDEVVAARCTLPMQVIPEIKEQGLGMRHQAALGIACDRDAVALVVSEERGTISLSVAGQLELFLSPAQLSARLRDIFEIGSERRRTPQGLDWSALRGALTVNLRYKLLGLLLASVIWLNNVQEVRTDFHYRPGEGAFIGYNDRSFGPGSLYLANRDQVVLENFALEGSNFMLLYVTAQEKWLDERFLERALVIPVGDRRQAGEYSCQVSFRNALALRVKDPVTVVFEEVQALDRPVLGVQLLGELPQGYHLDPNAAPLVQIEGDLPPLLAPQSRALEAQEALRRCRTEPPLNLSERTGNIANQRVRLLLPDLVAEVSPVEYLDAAVTVIIQSDALPKSPAEIAAEETLTQARAREREAVEKLAVADAERLKDIETAREKEPWTLDHLKNIEDARELAYQELATARKNFEEAKAATAKARAAPEDERRSVEHKQALHALETLETAAEITWKTRQKLFDGKVAAVTALKKKLEGALEAQRAAAALDARFDQERRAMDEWRAKHQAEVEQLRARFREYRAAPARQAAAAVDEALPARLSELSALPFEYAAAFQDLRSRLDAYHSQLSKYLIAFAEWQNLVSAIEADKFPAVAQARSDLKRRELDLEALRITFESEKLGVKAPDQLAQERWDGQSVTSDPITGAWQLWQERRAFLVETVFPAEARTLGQIALALAALDDAAFSAWRAAHFPDGALKTQRDGLSARIRDAQARLDALSRIPAEYERARQKATQEAARLAQDLESRGRQLAQSANLQEKERLEAEITRLRQQWRCWHAMQRDLDLFLGVGETSQPQGWVGEHRRTLEGHLSLINVGADHNGDPPTLKTLLDGIESRGASLKPPPQAPTPPVSSPETPPQKAPGENGAGNGQTPDPKPPRTTPEAPRSAPEESIAPPG